MFAVKKSTALSPCLRFYSASPLRAFPPALHRKLRVQTKETAQDDANELAVVYRRPGKGIQGITEMIRQESGTGSRDRRSREKGTAPSGTETTIAEAKFGAATYASEHSLCDILGGGFATWNLPEWFEAVGSQHASTCVILLCSSGHVRVFSIRPTGKTEALQLAQLNICGGGGKLP